MRKPRINITIFLSLAAMLVLTACATPMPQATATPTIAPSETTAPTQTDAPTSAPTDTATPASTATPAATETPVVTLTSTVAPKATETIGEMLKSRIVFYLILPEKGRTDACGDITVEPIISKRFRTGNRFEDVQIALNMLLGMHVKRYGSYYSAMWDTDLTIASTKYKPESDEMIIDFTGYLPVNGLSTCDKHGIREQIWKTFYHYGIKQKIFTFNGGFLIDQLNRK